MLLRHYVERYSVTRDLAPGTVEHYRWVVASFEAYAGRIELFEFTEELVCGWLAWLRSRGRSPWTVKQRRISLLVLWRSAWLDGLATCLPPLRRQRPLHYAPEAWTVQEVRQLVAAAERLLGCFPRTDISRGLWLGSLVRAGYDSGLRLGDLLRFPARAVGESPIQIRQAKTGRCVTVRFRPDTAAAIAACLADGTPRKLLWPLWGRREALYRLVRRTVLSSGIRPGTFRWLRRAAATACERQQPGSGTVLLGHASRATTEAWYVDRSQVQVPPLPGW